MTRVDLVVTTQSGITTVFVLEDSLKRQLAQNDALISMSVRGILKFVQETTKFVLIKMADSIVTVKKDIPWIILVNVQILTNAIWEQATVAMEPFVKISKALTNAIVKVAVAVKIPVKEDFYFNKLEIRLYY